MQISDLIDNRAKAGHEYAAAVVAFVEKRCALAAIEAALCNSNINHAVPSFSGRHPDVSLLAHPTYCAGNAAYVDWGEKIGALVNKIMSGFQHRGIS